MQIEYDNTIIDIKRGTKVIDSQYNILANVSGWTNADAQWILTSINDNTKVNKLYPHFIVAEYQNMTTNEIYESLQDAFDNVNFQITN